MPVPRRAVPSTALPSWPFRAHLRVPSSLQYGAYFLTQLIFETALGLCNSFGIYLMSYFARNFVLHSGKYSTLLPDWRKREISQLYHAHNTSKSHPTKRGQTKSTQRASTMIKWKTSHTRFKGLENRNITRMFSWDQGRLFHLPRESPECD